jgi:hypothetical protein
MRVEYRYEVGFSMSPINKNLAGLPNDNTILVDEIYSDRVSREGLSIYDRFLKDNLLAVGQDVTKLGFV